MTQLKYFPESVIPLGIGGLHLHLNSLLWRDTGSTSSKGKSKYQFHKASNTDDQNLHMSQFTIIFVFSGKAWLGFLFTQQFKTTEKRFIH
jgi:hypothetical protein